MFRSPSSGRLASIFKNASVGVDMVGWLGSARSLAALVIGFFLSSVRVRASTWFGRSFGRRADFKVRIDSTRSIFERLLECVCVVGAPLIASPLSRLSRTVRAFRESSHGVRGGEKEEKT
jgi:hypothetical protein